MPETARLRIVFVGAIVLGVALRFFRVGTNGLDFDETFTASAARLPVGKLLTYLRLHDAHPPLDYLLRVPFARAAASPFWFRLPSIAASVAALVVFALWMRRYGRLGAFATVAFAIGSFQLTYGRDARMYAALELAGVVGARLADDWLRRPSRWQYVGAGVATLAALYLHAGGMALAAGLFVVPGLRRDRDAWVWRGAVAGAGVVWAATWGPSFLSQLSRNKTHWIPLATPHNILATLNELVDITPVAAGLVVAMVGAGAVALLRGRSPLLRVWVSCALVPTALVVMIGFRAHVLLPRTLAPAGWGALVALAALVDLAWSRWWLLGCAVGLMVLGVSVPSTARVLTSSWAGQESSFHWVATHAVDGDVVAIRPGWMGPMVEWEFDARRGGTARIVKLPDDNSEGLVLGGGRETGRVWWITSTGYPGSLAGFRVCGPRLSTREFDVVALCRQP